MLPEKMLCIASISSAHGIKGHLKVRTFLENPSDIDQYKDLLFEDGGSFCIQKVLRVDKGSVIVTVKGVTDRNQAEALKGKRLFIPREQLPNLEEDTYYHTDLINLDVEDEQGRTVGKVKYVHDYGAGPVLEVYDLHTQKSALVPFRDEAVPSVSLAKGIVVVQSAYLKDLE